MTRSALLASLFAALALPAAAHAARHRCPDHPVDSNLALVFANGMFTSAEEAESTLALLRRYVPNKVGFHKDSIHWACAYNESEGLIPQLWEVSQQRLRMSVSQFIRVLEHVVEMPPWLRDEMTKLAAEVDLTGFVDENDLDEHVQMYRDHLLKGHEVVVLAHSQGNFYANAAYARLFETAVPTPGQDSFGLVSVATPAVRVAGRVPPECPRQGCYTTLNQDLLIAAVRHRLPDTLPGNSSADVVPTLLRDRLGHSFEGVYFDLDHIRARILDHIHAHVYNFEGLSPTVSQGILTANLEWDSTADIDLHVYEAGRRGHVYYAYPIGESGVLDLDDQDGYGPENYYAQCEHLLDGRYEIAADYYEGDSPVTVRARITAGHSTRTFTRTLDPLQAGDGEPTSLGYVDVRSLDHPRVFDLRLREAPR